MIGDHVSWAAVADTDAAVSATGTGQVLLRVVNMDEPVNALVMPIHSVLTLNSYKVPGVSAVSVSALDNTVSMVQVAVLNTL